MAITDAVSALELPLQYQEVGVGAGQPDQVGVVVGGVEGAARDLIRSLNGFRKLAGLGISDKVNVVLEMPEALRTEIGPHWEWISHEILAADLSFGPGETEFDLNGHRVRVQLTSAEDKPR